MAKNTKVLNIITYHYRTKLIDLLAQHFSISDFPVSNDEIGNKVFQIQHNVIPKKKLIKREQWPIIAHSVCSGLRNEVLSKARPRDNVDPATQQSATTPVQPEPPVNSVDKGPQRAGGWCSQEIDEKALLEHSAVSNKTSLFNSITQLTFAIGRLQATLEQLPAMINGAGPLFRNQQHDYASPPPPFSAPPFPGFNNRFPKSTQRPMTRVTVIVIGATLMPEAERNKAVNYFSTEAIVLFLTWDQLTVQNQYAFMGATVFFDTNENGNIYWDRCAHLANKCYLAPVLDSANALIRYINHTRGVNVNDFSLR